LPQAYALEQGSLTILPVVRNFKDAPVRLGLLFSTTATIVAPTLFVWRVLSNYQATRERLRVHTWLLEKLLPREAGEGLVPRRRAE